VIAGGPPYRGDPFKRYAPVTILAKQEIELWAKEQLTCERMLAEEEKLNGHYQGEWTKEGTKGRVTTRPGYSAGTGGDIRK